MSFQIPPPVSLFTAPSITDDVTKGIYVGMTVVDTSVFPPVVYVCTSNAIGAAKWAPVGVTVQSNGFTLGALTTVNFQNASVVLTNGTATVNPNGGWRNYYAESALEGQTFFSLMGLPVAPQSHQVFANGMLLRLGAQYDYIVGPTGITLNFSMGAGQPLIVYY